MYENRTLVRGDNLEEMRKFRDECIDLIATDPPFNSKRDYFVPYRDQYGQEPDTLVRAFTDTWNWGEAAEDAYQHLLVEEGGQIGDTIQGLRQFLNETPMMAYLVMMAIRIVEMHRILKPIGSLYLHCDPSASHYLKIVLDAVFGPKNFRNEIVWSYRRWAAKHPNFQRMHDIILRYAKSTNVTWNQLYEPRPSSTLKRFGGKEIKSAYAPDGRRIPSQTTNKESKGVPVRDVWEISIIAPSAKERLGYPTQKPIELYKRIVTASSNEDSLVLDPFCGCGTTLMAAEELNRHWIGIDLTYLAIGAVRQRIQETFPQIRNSVSIIGTPETEEQALRLARNNPHAFEEWCVTHLLKFKSNAKKVADGGIDGTFRFPIGPVKGRQAYGKAVAQVKGGNYTLSQVRDFRTAMQNVEADLGVFVVTSSPTRGMQIEAARAGTYRHPFLDMEIPVLQIHEIRDYFRGILPKLPFGERAVL